MIWPILSFDRPMITSYQRIIFRSNIVIWFVGSSVTTVVPWFRSLARSMVSFQTFDRSFLCSRRSEGTLDNDIVVLYTMNGDVCLAAMR